ncbi:MAG: HD domain-containing protein [bacterium]|nr:HD domain-containing protein [bacterium]
MIFKAIKFAADAHTGQFRKGTKIPYISHPINVMKILCEYDCSQDVIIAGILHDTVEDTSVTIEHIEEVFGKNVSDIVRGASEPEKLKKDPQTNVSWKERKQHTIDFIKKDATLEQLLVSCADKLDNSHAILDDFNKLGDKLWKRFNAGKDEQKWYYSELSKAFRKQGKKFGDALSSIANQLSITVKKIFK